MENGTFQGHCHTSLIAYSIDSGREELREEIREEVREELREEVREELREELREGRA